MSVWRALAALGLFVILLVALATSGRQRIGSYKVIDEADRIDDWLYLPETPYAFMLIMIISAGAGPYSLDAVVWDRIAKSMSALAGEIPRTLDSLLCPIFPIA